MPLATLEALSAGLPVVVSDSGGLAELRARNGRVRVVPSDDVASLAAALRTGLDAARSVNVM
jgi:glycosyltransferase involved in cell wall biosynthesis